MNGVKRVFAFCCLTAVLPACLIITPLYLKHQVFKDRVYNVTESDILEIRDGMSTVFCQEIRLKMVSSFNAFQLNKMPRMSSKRKQIRLKKSMTLPDDTLEYWGFFLLSGATVKLKVCSKHYGARVMVVKGQKNLHTCGLLDHNQQKLGTIYDPEKSQVRVTYEHHEVVEDDIPHQDHHHNSNKKKFKSDNIENDNESKLNDASEDLSPGKPKPKRHTKFTLSNEDIEDAISSKMRNRKNRMKKLRSNPRKDLTYFPLDRKKRDTVLDRGVAHGGNAQKVLNASNNSESSASSFESSLYDCWVSEVFCY